MKKFFIFFMLLFFINGTYVLADQFNITSDYVILYNLNDNKVLYEQKSQEKAQIASLTKIMTTIVAMEKAPDLDEVVVVSKEAFVGISEYSQAGLKVGNKVTIRDLLYATMLPSGADAVNTLALHLGGSIDGFVELMNEKARELGLKDTHFDNPIGMDSDDNYSTASDIATLLLYGLKNEEFKKIFTAREYKIDNLNISMKTTLISYSRSYGLDISEIQGAKSGFTDGAGLCLASIASIDDVDYLLITMGADVSNRSNAVRDTLEIYGYYSSSYSYQKIIKKGQSFGTIPIRFGKKNSYEVLADDDLSLYLENNMHKNKVEYIYEGLDTLTFQTQVGDKLGTIHVRYGDSDLTTYDVFLDEEIEYYHPVIYGVIVVAILMMLWSIGKMHKSHRMKKKQGGKKK